MLADGVHSLLHLHLVPRESAGDGPNRNSDHICKGKTRRSLDTPGSRVDFLHLNFVLGLVDGYLP